VPSRAPLASVRPPGLNATELTGRGAAVNLDRAALDKD
jgi:hypothetical protein